MYAIVLGQGVAFLVATGGKSVVVIRRYLRNTVIESQQFFLTMNDELSETRCENAGLVYKYVVLVALLYGIVCQLAARLEFCRDLYMVMSFGMIFLFPFCAGLVTVALAKPSQQKRWLFRIFAPWPPTILGVIVSIVVGWEGAICAAIAITAFIPLCSIGGIVAGVVLGWYNYDGKLRSSVIVLALVTPFGSATLESIFVLPQQVGQADTQIVVYAPSEKIWSEIASVRKITEPLDGFFYRIGFPKAIEATISYHGAGAVRNATFEGGLQFIETVTIWDPPHRLDFKIEVDPSGIPTTTLDPHVAVGGRYFDVVEGSYSIERLDTTKAILHLSSVYRVSTRFNFFANALAGWLMSDIQNTILKVVKTRAENSE